MFSAMADFVSSTYKTEAGKQTSTSRQTHTPERLTFGNQSLIVFPNSNIFFRLFDGKSVSKEQTCLLDNLWIAHNKKDTKYFIAVMNSLVHVFDTNKTHFKFYVVFKGRLTGVFSTWLEVLDSIQGEQQPRFKGFHNIAEAHSAARSLIGLNYYISPSLRNYTEPLPYQVLKDTDKILFCQHCEILTKTVRNLNQERENLTIQNQKLISQLSALEKQYKISQREFQQYKEQVVSRKSVETQTVFQQNTSNPLMGMFFPKEQSSVQTENVVESQTVIQSEKLNPLMVGVLPKNTTLVQTKDKGKSQTVTLPEISNPFMADTLPKSINPVQTGTSSSFYQDSSPKDTDLDKISQLIQQKQTIIVDKDELNIMMKYMIQEYMHQKTDSELLDEDSQSPELDPIIAEDEETTTHLADS